MEMHKHTPPRLEALNFETANNKKSSRADLHTYCVLLMEAVETFFLKFSLSVFFWCGGRGLICDGGGGFKY